MSIDITMPALSPTMEEGKLAKWLVKEGDAVAAGDVIAEIETDKATMEVEAVDEGTVAKIIVPEGSEGVKVNAVIAVLAGDGEDAASVEAPTATEPSKPAAPEKSAEMTADQAPDAAASGAGAGAASGADMQPAPAGGGATANGERLFATPLARRIAEQKGLDLASVKGSGPHGRIIKADVEMADGSQADMKPAAAPPVAAVSGGLASAMPDDVVLALFEEGKYDKKPHDGMRRVIAERLTQSSQTIPSYFVTMECRIDALLALRKQLNEAAPKDGEDKPAYKISVNDMVVKAMAMALRAVPMANVSWTSTDRIYHHHSDVGVAVAIDDGLFTPIVRRAEEKALSTISAEIKDMAARAQERRLKPEEYQGGCTAVSNMGMFGVKEFTSIINPPHASIVSIGAGEKRAMVDADGALAVGTMMAATFAFDHRAIDGALGARLAAAFKNLIENPMGMLV